MRIEVAALVTLAAVSGCSGPAVSSRVEDKRARSHAGSAAAGGASGVTDSRDLAVDTADVLLPAPPPLPPVAGTQADLPFATCEVGKFCPIQTRGEEDCGTLSLTHDVMPKPLPGNVLVLFDQSSSMQQAWGSTGQTKLRAAQAAIANAITGLQDSLNVGAIFFPTYACSASRPGRRGGSVASIDGPGQIPFQPGRQFLAAWSQHWASAGAGTGMGTPLQEAFDRADAALRGMPLTGAVAVIAVTDGQPNCLPDPQLTMLPTAAASARSQAWLRDQAIKTYVVGLPGANGVQLLNDIAANGGTMTYVLPDDPQLLQAKLEQVVQDTIVTTFQSCEIDLVPAATPPQRLQMSVVEAADGKRHHIAQMLDAGSGWSVSADGGHVAISGQLCTDAKTGRFRAITFEYPCDPHVPPPSQQPIPQ